MSFRSISLSVILTMLLGSATALAQSDSTFCYGVDVPLIKDAPWLYRVFPDSSAAYLVLQPGDTLKSWEISPAYEYRIVDSLCAIDYTFAHLRRNATPIDLVTWRSDSSLVADAAILSSRSISDTFSIHPGDSVSLYRQLLWADSTRNMTASNYFARDTLGFAVELVRAGSYERIALLDSVGVLSTPAPTQPTFSTTSPNPIMANITWVAPPDIHDTLVCVRHRLYQRGSGDHHLRRSDYLVIRMYRNPEVLADFLSPFGSLPRRISTDLSSLRVSSRRLGVRATSGGETLIDFSGNGQTVAIAVYDASGCLVVAPICNASGSTGSPARVMLEAGIYFAVLFQEGEAVACEKFVVNK